MIKFIFSLLFLLVALGASWLTPWSQPRAMITVTGEAKQQISNQVARFNVSVIETNKDKQTAVDAVNQAMAEITTAVKEFGIEEKDLTTQNVSVYETDEPEIMIYPPRPRSGEKQWQASNSLAIILRDVNQASALADLLQGFSMAQVSGPSFSVDDTNLSEQDLLVDAMADAREKAERLAEAGGRKLGKVLTASEGYSSAPYPLYSDLMAVGEAKSSAPVEPGSTQMTKTLTVVFELK
jgi:hypothetical protein